MDINYAAWKFWWDIAITVLLGVNVVYTWIVNRSKANASAIGNVNQRLAQLSERVNQLESDVRHLPDHQDLGNLHEKVNAVANSMSSVQGELQAINRTLGLINDHLLNGGRK